MKILATIALTSLAVAQAPVGMQTTAGPIARERWQRTLTPPAGRPAAEQCVVLDADLFANAAPGLRDVRVMQGLRELQYAVDESHDDRETSAGLAPPDDRSIFDVVGTAQFRDSGMPIGFGFVKPIEGLRDARFRLPAHVPVERITLQGTLDRSVSVRVIAVPQWLQGTVGSQRASGPLFEPAPEIVNVTASPVRESLFVTLGANLQDDAAVAVVIAAAPGITGVSFEMRRRELCYKPMTNEPVHIVYGDPEAQSIHYDFALHYRPSATPLLATLGPRETNPAYQLPIVAQTFALSLKQKLGIAIGLSLGMLIVTLGAIFGLLRRSGKA